VWLVEIHGHFGHSHTWGCIFYLTPKADYGTIVLRSGRRVALETPERTTAGMYAAAYRPLKTGSNEKCPHCSQTFPDQAFVDSLPGPQNKNQHKEYETTHFGQRFGKPPILPIDLTRVFLCILHVFLRLAATTFQRTIESNLNTQEKVDVINEFIKKLTLGCKKVVLRKRDGTKTVRHRGHCIHWQVHALLPFPCCAACRA
jgi:hypothetical protein